MATNFPGSLDTSTQQPTIASSDEMDDSGKEHDVVHTNHSGAIIALETKLGSTDSNPSANAVLMGTGSGTSAWDTTPTFTGLVTASGGISATTLTLTDTTDTGSDNSDGALNIGATTGQHLAFDTNEILSKSDGTTVGDLHIQTDGGDVKFGNNTALTEFVINQTSSNVIEHINSHGTQQIGPLSSSGFHIYTDMAKSYIGLGNAAEYVFHASYFYPATDNHQDCGASSKRWDDIRATNGSIVTSDQRDKTDVTNIDLGLSFIDSLRPVTYKWDDRSGYTGTRTHMGFIAQEVATTLGSNASGRALWIKDDPEDVEEADGTVTTSVERQGLRYTELLAPLVKAVQELSARVTALEG